MELYEALKQLEDLKKDRESFIDGTEATDIFKQDAEAIKTILDYFQKKEKIKK